MHVPQPHSPTAGTREEAKLATLRVSMEGMEDGNVEAATAQFSTTNARVESGPSARRNCALGEPCGAQVRDTRLSHCAARAVATDPPLADTELRNVDALRGAIAVVQRGKVPFVEKARRVQAAGVVGVIFVNHEDKLYMPFADRDENTEDIRIPCVCIRSCDAALVMQSSASLMLEVGEVAAVPAGPEEMLAQFFESCIVGAKVAMGEGDWETSVLHVARFLQFVKVQEEAATDEERQIMSEGRIDVLTKELDALVGRLAQELLGLFAEASALDDVQRMYVVVQMLHSLGRSSSAVVSPPRA